MSDQSEARSLGEGEAPGAALARLRAARELSVADVAERIKYSPRQIEALEADDYGKLPGTTFVRGMIRGYAKLLQTDPGPVLRRFEDRHAPEQVTLSMHSERIPFPDGSRRATRLYLALAGLAVAAAGAILYEWQFGLGAVSPLRPAPPARAERASVTQASVPLAPVEPPQVVSQDSARPAKPAEPAAVADQSRRISLEFRKESWVEIKDGGGNTLMSKLNPGGSSATVQGKPPFSLTIGNASNVRLTYDDTAVDLAPFVKVEVARLILE
ncbi:MAG: helix-turn-helix domain-containing protein [Betaproteobacteria bacterium]|nr:helix-turn-helix domain-containing protein [Betaproteobacteria bacterium]